jgi:hypothetical protein
MVIVVSFHLSRRRSFQTVRNGKPFTAFGQGFDDDQLGPGFVALVQFGVNCPREGLGVVRNDADAGKRFPGWDTGVGNDMDIMDLRILNLEP